MSGPREPTQDDQRFTLVYDPVLRRPGCAILQAVGGGDPVLFRELYGGADNWLIAPTPDMARIEGTREQWAREAGRGVEETPGLGASRTTGASLP